jgi:hypothetical protein
MEKHLIKHVILTEVLVVGYGHFLVKVNHTAFFDGKSLFEMTVDRNRAIADTILVEYRQLPFE